MYGKYFYLLILITLVACQSLAAPIEPIPTPIIWQVQHTPTMNWMGSVFNQCIQKQPEIGLLVFERSAPFLDIQQTDFIIRWGAPDKVSAPAFNIGMDELAIVVHPSNSLQTLTLSDLQAIYSANMQTWADIVPETSLSGDIQVWTFPQDEDIEQIFEKVIGINIRNPMLSIAPDAEAMLQAVASSPLAIGYLPQHWIDERVHQVKLVEPTNNLKQPILVMTQANPSKAQEDWLLCLQTSITK